MWMYKVYGYYEKRQSQTFTDHLKSISIRLSVLSYSKVGTREAV